MATVDLEIQALVAEATKTIKKFSQETSKNLKQVDDSVKEVNQSVGGMSKQLRGLNILGVIGVFDEAASVLRGFAQAFIAPINSFRAFETGLTGVAKTTNLAGAAFLDFTDDINELANRLPFTREELTGIAQTAGQLGVRGSENILRFTETIAKLGTASDLQGEAAAAVLTRILTITREGTGNIDRFASVIVALGNNFAATESQIARVTNEVARATTEFNVTAAEAAAVAAALKGIGVEAEAGGTAIGKAFRAINAALRTGGVALQELERLTGRSGEELRKQFGEDAVGVFQRFVEGLGEAQRQNESLTDVLGRLNLSGERILKTFPALAKGSTELGRALRIAGAEAKNATALQQEFNRASQTLDNRLQVLDNAFEGVKIQIASAFIPAVRLAVDTMTDFLTAIAGADGVMDALARTLEVGFIKTVQTFTSSIVLALQAVQDLADFLPSVFGGAVTQGLDRAINDFNRQNTALEQRLKLLLGNEDANDGFTDSTKRQTSVISEATRLTVEQRKALDGLLDSLRRGSKQDPFAFLRDVQLPEALRELSNAQRVQVQAEVQKILFPQSVASGIQAVLRGAQGATELFTSGVSLIAETILPGIGQAAGQIFQILALGPEQVRQLVASFLNQIPVIIENVLLAIPAAIEEFAERLPEIIPPFIQALARAAPQIGAALAGQMPTVAVTFATSLIRQLPEIAKAFGEALLDTIPGVGGGGGFLEGVPVIGGLFQQGGVVPPGFPNDSFVAGLTSGERVLTANDTSNLERFLQSQSGQVNNNAILERLDSIANALVGGQNLNLAVNIGERQLADAMLNVNRRGFRTA